MEEMSTEGEIQMAKLMLDLARSSLQMQRWYTGEPDYIYGRITQKASLKRIWVEVRGIKVEAYNGKKVGWKPGTAVCTSTTYKAQDLPDWKVMQGLIGAMGVQHLSTITWPLDPYYQIWLTGWGSGM